MVKRQFDYDKKFQDLLTKIEELKDLSEKMDFNLSGEIDLLEGKMAEMRDKKYSNLSPWEKILLVRNPERPTSYDYIEYICDDWLELHGDRHFRDDKAIIAGIGSVAGQPITIIGHQRGKSTADNILRNFGMPHPEGYRKILRMFSQAEKFNRPVINLIDTQGAYPGMGAEERGQAWCISQALMVLSHLKVPVISIVTGEGGSGGALALAVADRLLMLSNAVFSIASAEACASILWKDVKRVEESAQAMRITAQDLYQLGIVDEIIEEPIGGAQEAFIEAARGIKESIGNILAEILEKDRSELLAERYNKLRKIGIFNE